jgi:poly(3-hydroxybutyrate) depolymerase
LIVLAHGNSGDPGKFKILMTAWAEAGYVVAAPQFPLTNTFVPGGSQTGDFVNQPADVSFVLDEVLKLSRKSSDSKIAGLVDKRHIGVAGLSLGGGTVYGLVFNTCCRDKRFDAALLMSGVRLPFEEGEDDFRSLPAMLIHGDADSLYRFSQETYPLLTAPKWFVTLHGSTHSAPFEDSLDPADDVVPVISTAFFDRYLKNEKAAAKDIVDAVAEYGQAQLEREL